MTQWDMTNMRSKKYFSEYWHKFKKETKEILLSFFGFYFPDSKKVTMKQHTMYVVLNGGVLMFNSLLSPSYSSFSIGTYCSFLKGIWKMAGSCHVVEDPSFFVVILKKELSLSFSSLFSHATTIKQANFNYHILHSYWMAGIGCKEKLNGSW